jgi:hypothetical protein
LLKNSSSGMLAEIGKAIVETPFRLHCCWVRMRSRKPLLKHPLAYMLLGKAEMRKNIVEKL